MDIDIFNNTNTTILFVLVRYVIRNETYYSEISKSELVIFSMLEFVITKIIFRFLILIIPTKKLNKII